MILEERRAWERAEARVNAEREKAERDAARAEKRQEEDRRRAEKASAFAEERERKKKRARALSANALETTTEDDPSDGLTFSPVNTGGSGGRNPARVEWAFDDETDSTYAHTVALVPGHWIDSTWRRDGLAGRARTERAHRRQGARKLATNGLDRVTPRHVRARAGVGRVPGLGACAVRLRRAAAGDPRPGKRRGDARAGHGRDFADGIRRGKLWPAPKRFGVATGRRAGGALRPVPHGLARARRVSRGGCRRGELRDGGSGGDAPEGARGGDGRHRARHRRAVDSTRFEEPPRARCSTSGCPRA